MPLPTPGSPDCVSRAIHKLMQEGYSHDQAVAIALNHCHGKKKSSSSCC